MCSKSPANQRFSEKNLILTGLSNGILKFKTKKGNLSLSAERSKDSGFLAEMKTNCHQIKNIIGKKEYRTITSCECRSTDKSVISWNESPRQGA